MGRIGPLLSFLIQKSNTLSIFSFVAVYLSTMIFLPIFGSSGFGWVESPIGVAPIGVVISSQVVPVQTLIFPVFVFSQTSPGVGFSGGVGRCGFGPVVVYWSTDGLLATSATVDWAGFWG